MSIKMTCKPQNIKTDYYLPEKDEIYNYTADQTVIIKEEYLKFICPHKKKIDQEPHEASFLDEWYPYVNSYYPYTEDVDAFARVNHLLGSRPSFASISTEECQSLDETVQDKVPYTENAAQLQYLESNPVSFIILGKPCIGEQELGKLLADYWQCVYIDPEVLIEQEIFSGSRAGQCIQFNLKCGRAIGIDVILKLVQKRVRSESAKHRGVVICGLPLIPNDLYKEDPLSSESAVFTVKEIFEDMVGILLEKTDVPPSKPHASISSKYRSADDEVEAEEEPRYEKIQPEEEGEEEVEGDTLEAKLPPVKPTLIEIPLDTGPDLDICQEMEIGTNYEDQLNFIFDLLKHPFMIIYIMCSSADVLEKRRNYRFDVESKQTFNLQTEMYNNILYNNFSRDNNMNEEVLEDFLDPDYMNINISQLNYLVRLPRHFPANVSVQLDTYHYTGLNFIERRVLMHDPQYFLKVDGRVSVQRMFQIVKSRLKVLPLQQVILPTRLNPEHGEIGEGGTSVFKDEVLTLQDWYREFSRKQVSSGMYNWQWSDWGTKCPVSLRKGLLKDGDSNYAVHFMNKIFFLANEDNFFKFYRNPRPFLLPPYPKPACKVYIFGPKYSAKTVLSRCLGFLLDGTVLSIAAMLAQFLMNQEEEYKEKIRQAAIAQALQLLNEQRAEEAIRLERERVDKIKEWLISTKSMIEDFTVILVEKETDQTKTSFQISSFPMAMKKVSVVETDSQLVTDYIRIKDQLHSMRIPIYSKVEEWYALIADKRRLLSYMPVHLRSKVVAKPATVFDDFVIEYAKNAVENANLQDASLNNKSLAEVVIHSIKTVEDERSERGENRGGWILDGMFCDQSVIEELYPDFIADEVIVLLDDDADYLVSRFQNEEENFFENYRDFFLSIGKLDAAWRSPSRIPKPASQTRIVRDILSDIINDTNAFNYGDEAARDKVATYRQHIIQFNEKWPEIKKYFIDRNIEPLEIKVANKSLSDLMKDVIRKVEDRYRTKATLFSEVDRAEEVQNFGSQMLQQNVGEGADFAGDETFEKNRRYGDTHHFCPVTFRENWVLWRGKEDHAVKFENKLYLLSSEESMKKFLEIPRDYLPGGPPEVFPPPRICIVGIPGTGKTAVAKALAKNYGLRYASFENLVKKRLKINGTQNFDELRRNENIDPYLTAYLKVDEPLSEDFLRDQIGISKFWFGQPTVGFVLDDFPKRPSDEKFMTKYKLIPDIIINLTCNDREIKSKLVNNYMVQWENEMNDKKIVLEEENKIIRLEWEEIRRKRFDELLDERREKRYTQKRKEKDEPGKEKSSAPRPYMEDLKEVDEETDRSGFRSESQVSFDSVAEQDDIKEVTELLDNELPEPIFKHEVESANKARNRFEVVVADTVNVESGFLKTLRALCTSDVIPFVDVTSSANIDVTIRNAFVVTDKYKFRTRSYFERCYDVSMEMAERLLSCGYFFLSKFGKTCPVQYYENKNPLQMYIPMSEKYDVYTVIHRSYIYYLCGIESQVKFKQDPLKYTAIESFHFPLITFKAAVYGPPKCGKTVLASRIAKEYGFKHITRGEAARYVLTYLPLSDLAKNMELVLRKGWELTDEMVAKCVEAASFDSKAVAQGVVFDGFPNTITEVRHLSYVGLVPNLAVELQATKSEIFECLSFDVARKDLPKFSERFIEHLLTEWQNNADTFRDWFDREYQVTAKIPISTSNWSVWTQARDYIVSTFFEIKHYFIHAGDDWPLRLANMQITPLEFLERVGPFKAYCPCCLHFYNTLKNGGEPPDRTGLVQYKQHFYWICSEHMEKFLKSPDTFMLPYNNHNLPDVLPQQVHLSSMPKNIFEDGACTVCYKQKMRFFKGDIQYAVEYNNKTYFFDEKPCQVEFMSNPQKYICEINFRPPDNYPPLNYEDLPIMGMLEQYVAKYVTRSLSFVARRRPVIPGLSIQASAVVGMGLYLKLFNRRIPQEYKLLYEEGDKLYNERRTKLINYLDRMKSVINPYLHYEEPLPEFEFPLSVKSESTESVCTIVTNVVKELVDNIDFTP